MLTPSELFFGQILEKPNSGNPKTLWNLTQPNPELTPLSTTALHADAK